MLQEEELKGVPVLVLANKQDLPNALGDQDVRFKVLWRFVDLQWTGTDNDKEQALGIIQDLCHEWNRAAGGIRMVRMERRLI